MLGEITCDVSKTPVGGSSAEEMKVASFDYFKEVRDVVKMGSDEAGGDFFIGNDAEVPGGASGNLFWVLVLGI